MKLSTRMNALLLNISNGVKWIEHKTKWLFVTVALLLYFGSLVILARKVSPTADLGLFLVKALSNLSIPFGVILLQELLELLSAIGRNVLDSTRQQFEIVALVILRSFFKDFYKLNDAVTNNLFGEPVKAALVKVVAIIAITVLVFVFRRLSQQAGAERRGKKHKTMNLCRQLCTIVLCAAALFYLLVLQHTFEIMPFICLVFTGMIVIDAVFFLWSIGRSHEFDMLMFDGGLVVSLILARFPLFTANKLSCSLAVVGVGFAVAALRLFVKPMEMEFLGRPSEDSVSRMDMQLSPDTSELKGIRTKLKSFMNICQTSERCVKNVQLVCDELLANIIEHASDSAEEITVSFAVYKELMTVTMSVPGKSYNPLRHSEASSVATAAEQQPGGLGIHIVRMASERLAYRREAGCNIVTVLVALTKRSLSEKN